MLKKLLVKDDNKQKRGQGRRQKKVFFYITRSEALKIVSIDLPITATEALFFNLLQSFIYNFPIFLKKWANPGPFLIIFVFFS